MFWKFLFRKIRTCLGLFNDYYVDVRALYAMQFDEVPSVTVVGMIDGTQVFEFFRERYRRQIVRVLQHCYFDHEQQDTFFNSTIFVLTDGRIVEVTASYTLILYTEVHFTWARGLAKQLAKFKTEEEAPKKAIGFAKAQAAE